MIIHQAAVVNYGWCEGQKCDIYTSLTKWTFNIRVEPNWISTYMSLAKERKKGRQLKENSVDHEAGGLGGKQENILGKNVEERQSEPVDRKRPQCRVEEQQEG